MRAIWVLACIAGALAGPCEIKEKCNQYKPATPACGPNEAWTVCLPSTPCQPSCTNTRPVCEEKCTRSGCACAAGFVRDSASQCVAAHLCPRESRLEGSITRTESVVVFGSDCRQQPNSSCQQRQQPACQLTNGGCVPQPTQPNVDGKKRCHTDSECPMDFACSAFFCERRPITIRVECSGGCSQQQQQVIQQVVTVTKQRCHTDSECPGGQHCEAFLCEHGARQMHETAACGLTGGVGCVPQPVPKDVTGKKRCHTSSECGRGFHCSAFFCEPQPHPTEEPIRRCREHSECLSDEHCARTVCVPGPAPAFVKKHECDNCPAGSACVDGACEMEFELPESGRCHADAECSHGERCTNGECAGERKPPGSCDFDDECSAGLRCVNARCEMLREERKPECTCDADCSSDRVCDRATQACVLRTYVLPECTLNSDCADSQVCEMQRCVKKKECLVDGDCAKGLRCSDYSCIRDVESVQKASQACTCDEDCPINSYCLGGVCERKRFTPCTAECAACINSVCDNMKKH